MDLSSEINRNKIDVFFDNLMKETLPIIAEKGNVFEVFFKKINDRKTLSTEEKYQFLTEFNELYQSNAYALPNKVEEEKGVIFFYDLEETENEDLINQSFDQMIINSTMKDLIFFKDFFYAVQKKIDSDNLTIKDKQNIIKEYIAKLNQFAKYL